MTLFRTLTPHVAWALGGLFVLLVVATVVVWGLRRFRPDQDFTELSARVRSWWIMVGVFASAMALSPTASMVFLGFMSFVALKEYLSLIPTRRADRRVLFWIYLAIPVQYYWVADAWYGMFIIFIPVCMFLLVPIQMVLIGETQGFLRSVGSLYWGLMMTVFNLSHVAFLLALPPERNPAGGAAGLVLTLVFLTQFNDVAQYFWGRLLGRHPVIPKVSPKKTWEGLIGGIATTVVLAALIGPWLTPLSLFIAVGFGLLIGLGGFFGDVTVSAVKRDLGIKDTGTLIPGHGGILDRVDSLTFTAPLFFHALYYLYY